MVGISRRRWQKKATGWWSEKVKEVVKRKKAMYKRALGEKSESAWKSIREQTKRQRRCGERSKGAGKMWKGTAERFLKK